jgi:hypothetical protein
LYVRRRTAGRSVPCSLGDSLRSRCLFRPGSEAAIGREFRPRWKPIEGNPYRVSVSSWSRLLSSTSCRATTISNRVPSRRRLLAWPQNRRSLGSAWVCARRTVGNFDGTNGSGGLGCLFARKPPVAKTAVFLSSRSAPFNFVLASTFVGAKTRSPRDPFF